jgi:Ni/Co efflux regulator RcnB
MLKRLLLTAALVSLASGAFAQSMDDSDMDDDMSGGMSMSHSSRDWQDDRDRGGERGGDHGRMGPDMRRMMMMHRMMQGMNGGAAFRIRSGDQVVAVRCPRDESMRACIDATTSLIEKLRGMRMGGGAGGMPGTAPGTGSGSSESAPRP